MTEYKIPVQKKMCETCIYRPDSPLDLKMLEDAVRDKNFPQIFEGHRVCHHSAKAICRGFWHKNLDHYPLGQIAERMGMIEFVQDDTLADHNFKPQEKKNGRSSRRRN